MNETDLKAIKELLDMQADRLEKRMDVRLEEQSEAFSKQMDVRFQEQEERLGKRMIQVFNEGFEQVVLPHLSEMSDKIDELDSRTGRIERKLDAVVEYHDRQGQEIKSIKKFVRMPEGA
jgi:hypothetical protein